MAVSEQEIRDYIIANADNPAAIAQAAAQAGVSAAQVASAIGVSPTVAQGIISGELQPLVGYTGGRQTGEGEFVGQETPYIAAVATNPDKSGGAYNVYEPTGDYRLTQQVSNNNALVDAAKFLGPAVLFGATPLISSALGAATGLTGAQLAAATGATVGGGTAAFNGQDVLKGALLGGATGYLTGGGLKSADQGLNSKLTMAQIESGLGTPGYGYGAQAAESGLFNPALIGSGAYTQTSYPYDMAEFLAADAQNLYSQVGSNLPAIEQNLVASGVDPLVAADIANTITLNPNMSTYDLTNYINTTFGGGNLYDVNAATQYPTSVLPDEGGLLSNLPTTVTPPNEAVTTTPVTTTPGTKAVDPDLAKIVSSGISKILPGLLTAGALNQMTNKPSVGALPTQGVPTNSPEYYQAIQQYYNTYMPEQPRDVATPLQQWYDSKYGA